MRRSLNVRFLLILLGSAGVLLLTCRGIHSLQVRRHAPALLDEARRATEQGQFEQAATYLGNYLTLVPDDTTALVQYGLTLAKLTDSDPARRRAVQALEQVLRREPARHEVRRALVRIAFDLGLEEEARPHLEILLEHTPNSAELERLLAECEEVVGNYARAADWLQKAVAHDPAHLESHLRLANLFQQQLDSPAQAEEVLDGLVAANPRSAAAYLARAQFRREAGRTKEAGADLAQARELAPHDAHILLTFADWAAATGAAADALATLERGLKHESRNATLHLARARLALREGRPQDALAYLRDATRLLPEQRDLLFLQAQVLLLERDFDAAAALLPRLRQLGAAAEWVRFLDALTLVQHGRWAPAAAALESLRPTLAPYPDLAFQTDVALGYCLAKLGAAEQAVAACTRAVAFDPTSAAARAGLAAALGTAGQLEDALAEGRRAVALPGAPGFAWIELARLLIVHNLRQPTGRRDWTEPEKVLREAAQRNPQSVEPELLQAELLVARNELSQARTVLERARARHPAEAAPWGALAALARKQGQPEEALRILGDADQRLGRSVELYRTRLQHWAQVGGAGALPALTALEDGLNSFALAEQTALLRELAEARLRLGDPAGAERLAQRVTKAQPHDPRGWMLLLDVYLQSRQTAGLTRALSELRQVDKEGAWWRYAEAVSLFLTASPGDAQAAAQARKLLTEIAPLRPSWSRVPLLEAYLDEREGNTDRAVENYLQAVRLGERQVHVLARLARLLFERRRFTEADQTVRRLEEAGAAHRDLTRLAVEIALAQGDGPRAVTLAQRLVPAASGDYREQLWLSQVYQTVQRTDEAEQVLRRALQQGRKVPDLWLALVRLLAATNQRVPAAAALTEAEAALSEDHRPLTLARGHEALGNRDLAAMHYRTAVKARPDDFLVLLPAANFHLRVGDFARAEPLLRQLSDPDLNAPATQVAWARRQLALGLAARGTEPSIQEALSVLDSNTAHAMSGVEDDRARARVLLARPGQAAEALRLLEATLPRAPLSPQERWLLAQLYEANNDVPRAREQMLVLVAADRPDPYLLAEYVRCLRRWGDEEEARIWTRKLNEIAPTLVP